MNSTRHDPTRCGPTRRGPTGRGPTRRGIVLAATTLAAAVASSRFARAGSEGVTIGFTGPLSGGAALYGRNCLSGLEMAVGEINAAGGLDIAGTKRKLDLVSLDDRYSPAEAALNAKRLVQQDGAAVVFCPHSGGVFAIQAFNQQDGFLLAAYTSVPTVTERGNALTLRLPPSFDIFLAPFARYEIKRFGPRLAMAGGDHEYAKLWAKAFAPAWETAGGKVVASNPMSYNRDADFYSGVSKVLAERPDVLFVGGASQPTALVVRQARELGFKGGFAVMDQAKLDEMAKVLGGLTPLEGAIGTLPLVYDDRAPAQDFVRRYRAHHPDDPNTEASLNYTGLYVVAGGMAAAKGSGGAKALRLQAQAAAAALQPAHNPNDVTGIAEKGGFEMNAYAGAVENGKLAQVPITA